jgi:hypothetical protein
MGYVLRYVTSFLRPFPTSAYAAAKDVPPSKLSYSLGVHSLGGDVTTGHGLPKRPGAKLLSPPLNNPLAYNNNTTTLS